MSVALGPRHVSIFIGEIRKMSENTPFNISSFYNLVSKKHLMAAMCTECGNILLPPKPMCTKCLSANLTWIEVNGEGKLLTYTIIYIAPEQFQDKAPYVVGIVELEKGLRLPGMIRDVKPDDIQIGMSLKLDVEASNSSNWPLWCRYFFRAP